MKHNHFIFIKDDIYKKSPFLYKIALMLNRRYRPVEIFRYKFKSYGKIVVIGLKHYGKNVKRRTNGYAKKYLRRNPNIKCIYCGVKLTNENISTEHIQPISKGGNNSKVNLTVCCVDCNADRGDKDFYKYLSVKNEKRSKYI